MGNLTRDPELRYTPNGAAVCTFGVATNRSYMVDGERREEVDFHRLVAWNKLAELCNQLLKKGTRVFISGRLQYREWETQDGQKRREAEIVVDDMIVITPKVGYNNSEEPVEKPIPVKEPVIKAEDTPEPETTSEQPDTTPAPDESISPDEDLPF